MDWVIVENVLHEVVEGQNERNPKGNVLHEADEGQNERNPKGKCPS